MKHQGVWWLLLVALLAACGDNSEPKAAPDMAAPDMVVVDMAPDQADAPDLEEEPDLDAAPDLAPDMPQIEDMADDAAPDLPEVEDMPADMSTEPLPGFGALSGDCQVLDGELTSAMPFIFSGALDFGADPYDMSDLTRLTAGGQYIAQVPNAGGDSVLSEVFAFEVLARCEGAKLLKTETEIDYINPRGKITDILVEIDGLKVGVSVVRAIAYPFDDPYPLSEADRILRKKLEGIAASNQNVTPQDQWVKQILSVMAYTPQHAQQIQQAWMALDAATRGDTILYITATEGDDRPIYNIE